MKRCLKASASLLLLIGLAVPDTAGQTPNQFPGVQNSANPGRAAQALWTPPERQLRAVRFSDYVDAHGERVVVPASYSAACGPVGMGGNVPCGCGSPDCCICGGCCYHPAGPGVYGPCPPSGTCPPYGYNDDMADLIGGSSMGLDQCGPHYFDIRGEIVYMTRDETFGRSINFTSEGPNATMDPALFRLSSDQLKYEYDPAFRIMGRYDIGPLAVVEFGYFGLHDQGDEAFFAVPPIPETMPPFSGTLGNLFSLFSVYGTAPPDVVVEDGPMGTTDRAVRHTIALNSDLQTAEISYRRYWVGFSPRISGTIFAGGRYTRFSEQFKFATVAELGTFDYDVDAENDIIGFQTGGDMWICIAQGVRLGAEGKAGIYNNRFQVSTVGTNNQEGVITFPVLESDRGNNISFIAESSADLVVDLLPSWSLRAGVEALWINSVALASANFNTGSPFGLPGQPVRVPFVAEQDNVLYYGARVGAEYIW